MDKVGQEVDNLPPTTDYRSNAESETDIGGNGTAALRLAEVATQQEK